MYVAQTRYSVARFQRTRLRWIRSCRALWSILESSIYAEWIASRMRCWRVWGKEDGRPQRRRISVHESQASEGRNLQVQRTIAYRALEADGLLRCRTNPTDARNRLVQRSPDGLALIDHAMEAHVENESAVKPTELAGRDSCLARLLAAVEPMGG